MNKNAYEKDFKDLLNRTLISYPFYDKSDAELITDTKRRTSDDIEFGLFKIEGEGKNSYFIDSQPIDSRVLILKNTLNSEDKVEIKLSSFVYPSYFMSSVIDKKELMKSSFNYQSYTDYRKLNNEVIYYTGKTVLVTCSWILMSKYIKSVNCVNIIEAPSDEKQLAQLIRKCFMKERKMFIQDIINKPSKYVSSLPVNDNILKEVFGLYRPKFEAELNRLDYL